MKSDEWLTPPEIIRALGSFDLDPCAPILRPWPTAKKHYSILDDGLRQKWEGMVWMNPPFGRTAMLWMRKLKEHGNGIALIPARTETQMFFETVWSSASGILFMRGRPKFYYVNGKQASFNSGAPICLIAYGDESKARIQSSGIAGHFVELQK